MKKLKINLSNKNDIKILREAKIKTELELSGKIYSARDAAHKRISDLINKKCSLPISFSDALIYYMGPAPAREGLPIGSCGPTSSYRMDEYLETTLSLGVASTIGKGERSDFVNALVKKYSSPYLTTIGGAGAYLAKCVLSARTILFPELGAEAVMELIVSDFPVIVAIDIYGGTVFKE